MFPPSSRSDIAAAPPTVIHRSMTTAGYMAMAESSQPQNLVDGVLYASPPGDDEHEDTVLAIAETLAAYAKAAGAKVFVGRETVLGEATVLQPDVAYLSRDRMHLSGTYLRGAPDLVVEVVARNTWHFDREVKFAAYAGAGIREAWYVDLIEREATVFHVDGETWVAEAAVSFGDALRSSVVEGIGAAGLEPRKGN